MWVIADSIAIVQWHNGWHLTFVEIWYHYLCFANGKTGSLRSGDMPRWIRLEAWTVNHHAQCHSVHKGCSIMPKGQGRANMISIPGCVQHGMPNTADHKDPTGSRKHPPSAAFIHPLVEHPEVTCTLPDPQLDQSSYKSWHRSEVDTTKAGAPEGKQSIRSAENPPSQGNNPHI